jgi:sugar lactone lactonase YvrE
MHRLRRIPALQLLCAALRLVRERTDWRRSWVLAAAAVVVGGTAATVALAGAKDGRQSRHPLYSVATSLSRPNSFILVNAERNAIVARIHLGVEPLRVSFGDRMFWVVAPEARTVFSIDPRTRKVRSIKLGKEPFDAATGGGALWVADHGSQRVMRVDLETGSVTRSQDLGSPQLAVAYGFGAVWVVNANENLLRLDPATLDVTATIEGVASSYEGYEPKIAIAADAIWVSDAFKLAVARVDPQMLRVTYHRAVAGNGITIGAGAVWSADGKRSVWRFTSGQAQRMRAGAGPIDVAASKHSVWAVNWRGHTLVRISPAKRRVVKRFPLEREPVAVAVGGIYIGAIVHF